MTEFSASTDGFEVLGSGTVIGAASSAVVLRVASMEITLTFSETGGEPQVLTDQSRSDALSIKVENFNNPLGTAWRSSVGTLEHRPLYLALAIYVIGDAIGGTRITHYSWSRA